MTKKITNKKSNSETLEQAENQYVDVCKNLSEVREAIDNIDNKIISLIALRAKYVKQAAMFKTDENSVKAPKRVYEVIESKKLLAEKYGISTVLVEKLYSQMIDFFINEELNEFNQQN